MYKVNESLTGSIYSRRFLETVFVRMMDWCVFDERFTDVETNLTFGGGHLCVCVGVCV